MADMKSAYCNYCMRIHNPDVNCKGENNPMPDMTFEDVEKLLKTWIPDMMADEIMQSIRDRVAELEKENEALNHWRETGTYKGVYEVDAVVAKQCFDLQTENVNLKNRVAELERELSTAIYPSYSNGELCADPLIDQVKEAHDDAVSDYHNCLEDNGRLIIQVVRLKSENAAMRALLKEHEWAADVIYVGYCPKCKRHQSQGHAPGCEWGKFAEGEKHNEIIP
ncbi:hypothetical protein [Sulfuricurvum sp.]|uniref:hypothetical protein n=1 Tax=Sulfuricurvum sp. TaxID=2025608 RepID=UPI0035652443